MLWRALYLRRCLVLDDALTPQRSSQELSSCQLLKTSASASCPAFDSANPEMLSRSANLVLTPLAGRPQLKRRCYAALIEPLSSRPLRMHRWSIVLLKLKPNPGADPLLFRNVDLPTLVQTQLAGRPCLTIRYRRVDNCERQHMRVYLAFTDSLLS